MAEAPRSVRRTLLGKLIPALAAATLACCAAVYGLANHFAQQVLDDWLLDSAMSLARQVHSRGGVPVVEVSPQALEIFEWDAVDRIYYEVESDRGGMLHNARIPAPASTVGTPAFYDTRVNGEPVRAVSVTVQADPGRVDVRVAETRHKRGGLTTDVLVSTLLFSMFVIAVVGYLVWRGIGSGVEILESSVRDVRASHSAAPLAPLPVEEVPSEVAPLVTELNSLIGDLSAALREKQRFIADAAHQLRTPLASLQIQFELARRETDPARQRAALDSALGVIGNTTRMLHQLLTLARVDEAAVQLPDDQPVDLASLVRQIVESRSDAVWRQGGDIGYEGPVEGVRVPGNAGLLREALANLLDNAEKHAAGGVITAGVGDDPPQIFVEDNGSGIPPAERGRVRDRFYRLPGAAAGGCGLGLAIVDSIARRHHARLLLEDSRQGRGLMARIVFE